MPFLQEPIHMSLIGTALGETLQLLVAAQKDPYLL